MATVYIDNDSIDAHLAIIKAALIDKYRVEIDFEETSPSIPNDSSHYIYQFVLTESATESQVVYCVMYRGIKIDPLGILSTHKPLKMFDEYLRALITPSSNATVNIYELYTKKITVEDIKIYPYEWYACFETDNNITNIKKILPKLIEKSKIIQKEDVENHKADELGIIKNNDQARLMADLMFANLTPKLRTILPNNIGGPRRPVGRTYVKK